MIQSFHTGMKGVVKFDGSSSEAFDIRSGVKQGCVLAPTLFGIFFAVMQKCAFGSSTEGVYLHKRSDGKLFNLSRLKAKTKIREVLITDLLFADDAALAAHTENKLQILLDELPCARSTVTNNLSLEAELKGRIGRAATTFARLQKRVWDGNVANGTRARGRPHLRYKDAIKRDMKDLDKQNTLETGR
ncbi:hypothetical protein Bbelb_303560 [Branchiostoma belcheri]|nr:hypothetical protein Bbelb_303560 [Branchiostoma belcheri]